MTQTSFDALLASYEPSVRALAASVRALVGQVIPDATEELDESAGLLGFSYIPGTYRGLIVAVAPQRSWVNLMFSTGAELAGSDPGGLLEGGGRRARHIKVRDESLLADPRVRVLLSEAAARTPRA
jgi:hypothetical protein